MNYTKLNDYIEFKKMINNNSIIINNYGFFIIYTNPLNWKQKIVRWGIISTSEEVLIIPDKIIVSNYSDIFDYLMVHELLKLSNVTVNHVNQIEMKNENKLYEFFKPFLDLQDKIKEAMKKCLEPLISFTRKQE